MVYGFFFQLLFDCVQEDFDLVVKQFGVVQCDCIVVVEQFDVLLCYCDEYYVCFV